MMKKIISFALTLFLSISVFALESLDQYVQLESGLVSSRGIERNYVPFDITYGIYDKEEKWNALTSVQFTKDVFDFTLTGEYFIPKFYWKLDYTTIDLGLGALYHFQRYEDLFSEQDFFIDTVFRLRFKKFELKNHWGYGLKAAGIFDLPSDVGWIYDTTLSESIEVSLKLPHELEVYFKTGSHDLYRYPLFLSPYYKTGVSFGFLEHWKIHTELGLRMHDQFITAPYLDTVFWKAGVRFSF